jgi:uncharacterized protein
MLQVNLSDLLEHILEQYTLPVGGIHGVVHWARVLENGRRLSQDTGANLEVVSLFAVLHDARRFNEHHDPGHGPRAADFARKVRGQRFDLADQDFELLHRACAGHTHELTHPDVTIQTCWDADRLDLGRVGTTPDPRYLCTAAAKRREMIFWADGRATNRIVPQIVASEWGIDLALFR